ncbi:MAG: Ig-like domain-containing protein, partial [Pseudomonadota bacterium]
MAVTFNKRILLSIALCMGIGSVAAQSQIAADLSVPEYLLGGPSSNLQLDIDDSKSLDIISPTGVNYDSGTGDIIFDVLGPLFCFELRDNLTDRALLLSLLDANGDAIVEGFRPADSLDYNLSESQIELTVPSDGACFYETVAGFGLAGNAPGGVGRGGQSDEIFSDRFFATAELEVEFLNVPQFVRPNEFINYQIEIRNVGSAAAPAVGFQELYPRNPTFYPDGQLNGGFYQCQGFGGASCGDAQPGIDDISIRGQTISIPAGGSITFDVFRLVFSGSPVGGFIDLYAGAVLRTTLGAAPWDSAVARMTVIGEGQTIAAVVENAVPPIADGVDLAQIRVTALDANKNPTPDVTVNLSNADGLSFTTATGVTGLDGTVLFEASTFGSEQAGTFLPQFTAPDIGTGGASTDVSVEFVAGAPNDFSAFTLVDNAVADGVSAGVIEVSVLDAFDNPVSNATVTVQDADGIDFAATSVETDANGVATFSATSTDSGTYSPVFAQASIAANATSDVTFVPGNPSQLAFIAQPSDTVVGNAIAPGVLIEVQDAN